MSNTFLKATFSVDAFSTNRIIFDDSDLVSMAVKCRMNNQIIQTTFLMTFSVFNDLLRFSGEVGEMLQLKVSDKLLSNEEQPYQIEFKESSIVFTNCNLKLSYLIADDNSCFSIDEITPISFLKQTKNLKANIKDFSNVELKNATHVNQELIRFSEMYYYYQGLLELNVSEKCAREKAGLLNNNLFKIAYCAFQKRK